MGATAPNWDPRHEGEWTIALKRGEPEITGMEYVAGDGEHGDRLSEPWRTGLRRVPNAPFDPGRLDKCCPVLLWTDDVKDA